ncbi:hypothetical protein [Pseudostreptobacillus hongkongensis]|uniref:hypothetical protein n=1 Tax=Pseudostreptobacillus hongkongensis TaxID=1162717 RepID=UPI00082AA3B2|nr:hypothetical protein [Pseudostreptobacillus hongkongensis]
MKKIILAISVFLTGVLMAHTPILDVKVSDKETGVLNISAGFDNGETAEGETIYILSDVAYDGNEEVFNEEGAEDFQGKLILFKGELDDNSKLSIPKPAVKRYIVVFYGGWGHTVGVKGISLNSNEEAEWMKNIEKYKKELGKYFDKMTTKKF